MQDSGWFSTIHPSAGAFMLRSFRYEADMTEAAASWLSEQGLIVRSEYPTPLGTCDLVGVTLDPARVEHRLGLGQRAPVTDTRKLALLEEIPASSTGRSATLADLARLACAGRDFGDLTGGIGWLLRHGYVVATPAGGYQRQTGWAPLEMRIVAVELKLEKVMQALRQAGRALSFATEAFIGFPVERARRIALVYREHLVAAGVGLLSIAANGCEILITSAPDSSDPNPLLRAQCVERFWRDFTRARRA